MQFLNDAKVVHHNLTPESIFVNAKVIYDQRYRFPTDISNI